MSIKRFGVSLDEEILDHLDGFVKDNSFANRSQAIRFFVEKNIAEKKWMCGHLVAGTVVLMYNQSKRDIITKITEIQQNFHDLILSSTQYYLDDDFCLHITTVKGAAHHLTKLSDRLITIKGIKHGKLVMSRAD
ncbi:MAG: nickel-responsive transcriptional regulator NikR [Tannerella sp.]|nr:nickel-responsive transcriptional regulator NikR [Tannerella sp.]